MIQLLVINDNSFMPGVTALGDFEFEITVSETALHAFNSIIHINPDVIFLNMVNPNETDGWQILQRIRHMQASREVPVLLSIPEDAEGECRSRLEKDTKTDYLVAPVSKHEILSWATKTLGTASDEEKKTVMVVDDDPVVLDLMKLYLGATYKVIVLHTAEEAIARLNISIPDIIMLDIAMPNMDGKELFKAIRNIKGCETVPILFQTGMAGINTVRECVKLGAAGFVIKPIQKSVLLERIEETLDTVGTSGQKCIYVFEEFDFLFTLIKGYLKNTYDVQRGESVLQSINHMDEYSPKALIIDFDNSAYIINRLREKSEQLKIPIILLSRDLTAKSISDELDKKNTYSCELPLNKEHLMAAIRNCNEWKE